MMFPPSNAGIIPRKRPVALSQSSPQGTRVFASGNSGGETPELLGETSILRFLWLATKGRAHASSIQVS